MNGGWTFSGESVALGSGLVTLVEGSHFCLSGPGGDIEPGTSQGLFVRDTRLLSAWLLRLDGEVLETLTVLSSAPYQATFLTRHRPAPGRADSHLLIQRDRYVGVGMREDLTVRNLGAEAAQGELSLHVDCDFADLFEVKEGRIRTRGTHQAGHSAAELTFSFAAREQSRGVRISAEGARTAEHKLIFRLRLPPRGSWHTSVLVQAIVNGAELPLPFPLDRPITASLPAERQEEWDALAPVLTIGEGHIARTLERSRRDLGALRIFDPESPDVPAIAAGAPWFMTLFGRDSLIASLMALPLDASLALGTVQTLAAHQGEKSVPATEEAPGRILHEMRFGLGASLALGGGNIYYGTADATPLFVMLLGELRRWGLAWAEVDRLLPAADRALEWIEHYGDRDGDGFVEYQRSSDQGLVNQGWKDSWDGINFADGRIAEPPIALAEVQAYVYAAYIARAYFADEAGDTQGARAWAAKAAALKAAFNERFWLPERGWYAVGLDADKRPIDALASNMGHCLWTGIIDVDKAEAVAGHLLSPAMFSGWGVRTLAASMGAYNPMSYHNGSVWPHDNGIIAAGLMRYGFVAHAQKVAGAVFEVARAFGGRLPELLCGFDRAEYARPVPYPTSCSPQAWAAATPIHLLRVLLRVDPWIPHGKIWIDPALPEDMGALDLTNLPLGGSRLSLHVADGTLEVAGLPAGVELVRAPRPPLTSIA